MIQGVIREIAELQRSTWHNLQQTSICFRWRGLFQMMRANLQPFQLTVWQEWMSMWDRWSENSMMSWTSSSTKTWFSSKTSLSKSKEKLMIRSEYCKSNSKVEQLLLKWLKTNTNGWKVGRDSWRKKSTFWSWKRGSRRPRNKSNKPRNLSTNIRWRLTQMERSYPNNRFRRR